MAAGGHGVRERQRVKDRPKQPDRMRMSAYRVSHNVREKDLCIVQSAGRPDVGLDAHCRAVSARIAPSLEGVGEPRDRGFGQVRRRGVRRFPSAESVAQPDRKLDLCERFNIETSGTYRPARGETATGNRPSSILGAGTW